MLKIKYLLGVIALFSLVSCTSYRVVSDVDDTVDFSEFETFEFYGWANDSDQFLTKLDKDRIEANFGEEALRRGITGVDEDGDIIASLFIVGELRTEQRANTMTTGMGHMGGAGWGRRGMAAPGWGWGTAHSSTVITEDRYVEGTLMCEVFDKDDKELIWQVIGTKRVSDDPKRRAHDFKKIIARMMREYPVKPVK